MRSVHNSTLAKVACVTGSVRLMQTVPKEKDVWMVFVQKFAIPTKIVSREKFALTAHAYLDVTKKRTVDQVKFVKKEIVFAQLDLSTLLLGVRTSTSVKILFVILPQSVLTSQDPSSVLALEDLLGILTQKAVRIQMNVQQTETVAHNLPVLEMEEAIVNVSILVTELNVEQMQTVKFAIINLSASVLTSMLATQAPILVAQRLSVSKTVTALVIRCVKWRTTDVLMLAVW